MTTSAEKPLTEEQKRQAFAIKLQELKTKNHHIIQLNAQLEQQKKSAAEQEKTTYAQFGVSSLDELRKEYRRRGTVNQESMSKLSEDMERADKEIKAIESVLAV